MDGDEIEEEVELKYIRNISRVIFKGAEYSEFFYLEKVE